MAVPLVLSPFFCIAMLAVTLTKGVRLIAACWIPVTVAIFVVLVSSGLTGYLLVESAMLWAAPVTTTDDIEHTTSGVLLAKNLHIGVNRTVQFSFDVDGDPTTPERCYSCVFPVGDQTTSVVSRWSLCSIVASEPRSCKELAAGDFAKSTVAMHNFDDATLWNFLNTQECFTRILGSHDSLGTTMSAMPVIRVPITQSSPFDAAIRFAQARLNVTSAVFPSFDMYNGAGVVITGKAAPSLVMIDPGAGWSKFVFWCSTMGTLHFAYLLAGGFWVVLGDAGFFNSKSRACNAFCSRLFNLRSRRRVRPLQLFTAAVNGTTSPQPFSQSQSGGSREDSSGHMFPSSSEESGPTVSTAAGRDRRQLPPSDMAFSRSSQGQSVLHFSSPASFAAAHIFAAAEPVEGRTSFSTLGDTRTSSASEFAEDNSLGHRIAPVSNIELVSAQPLEQRQQQAAVYPAENPFPDAATHTTQSGSAGERTTATTLELPLSRKSSSSC